MAALRAIETKRPERLFEEPFAAQLASPQVLAWLEQNLMKQQEESWLYVIVRTRLFDDFMMDGVCESRQVVILGAGMDARAFRLTWPSGTHV